MKFPLTTKLLQARLWTITLQGLELKALIERGKLKLQLQIETHQVNLKCIPKKDPTEIFNFFLMSLFNLQLVVPLIQKFRS